MSAPEQPSDSKPVVIYTDGGCSPNPGVGGWGVLLKFGTAERELCGGHPATTNNRMELQAAIEALTALKWTCTVHLYTDSAYVKNGITRWLAGWRRNGWLTASKKPVKNADLWRILDALAQTHTIDWRWVKGHSGDAGNERADELATKGLNAQRRG
ncbi:MAG: ribonuclease HI [Bradymonadia bacterium]|jgi:ribonuclease HI